MWRGTHRVIQATSGSGVAIRDNENARRRGCLKLSVLYSRMADNILKGSMMS